MINKDSVSKQEAKLQSMAEEIQVTDTELQDEQLLNLQLSSEYNALMTNLSHILNERNRILLECEGLKDTVSILFTQVNDMAELITKEQSRRDSIRTDLTSVRAQWDGCQQAFTSHNNEMSECK